MNFPILLFSIIFLFDFGLSNDLFGNESPTLFLSSLKVFAEDLTSLCTCQTVLILRSETQEDLLNLAPSFKFRRKATNSQKEIELTLMPCDGFKKLMTNN